MSKIIIDGNDNSLYHTPGDIWTELPSLNVVGETLNPNSLNCGWMPAVVRYISPEVSIFKAFTSLIAVECPPARHTVSVRFVDRVWTDEYDQEYEEEFSTEIYTINVPWHTWLLYARTNSDGSLNFLPNFNLLFQKTQAFSEDTLLYPPYLPNIYSSIEPSFWTKEFSRTAPIIPVLKEHPSNNELWGYSIWNMGQICFGGTANDYTGLTGATLEPYQSFADLFSHFISFFWTSTFYSCDLPDGFERITGCRNDYREGWSKIADWSMEEAHDALIDPYYSYGQLIETMEQLATPVGLTELFTRIDAEAKRVKS